MSMRQGTTLTRRRRLRQDCESGHHRRRRRAKTELKKAEELRRRPPQSAEGVELIGEYQDSGFKEPRYIARRADGQVIQLTLLLYLVAHEVDGERDFAEIARRV